MIRIVLLLTLLFAGAAAHARRVAIVVANQSYLNVPVLANPLNDARAVAAAFGPGGLGFDQVQQISNADARSLRRLPAQVREWARGADTVVVYLAGHGMRDEGRRNYFLPVDADIKSPIDIEAEGLDIEAIVNEIKAAAPRIGLIVVDACRNNPFNDRMGTRSIGRGLARRGSDGLDGVLIAYAADGGQVADDGRGGGLSPFAAAFVKRVRQPGTRVLEMLDEVSDEVRTATAGRQTPTRDGNLRVSAVLVPAVASPSVSPPRPVVLASVDLERETWDLCKGGAVAGPCRDYLAQWPAGTYARLAKSKIDLLEPASTFDDSQLAKSRHALAMVVPKFTTEYYGSRIFDSFIAAGGSRAGLERLANANDPNAIALFGVLLFYGLDGQAADKAGGVRWLRAGADQGNAKARHALGQLYYDGDGVPKNIVEAVRFNKLAADQGFAPGQFSLGVLYANGSGVEQNKTEAARLYKLAAAQGLSIAQSSLAVLYWSGEGVAQNKAEAARLFKLAADQGWVMAQYSLGFLYAIGDGVAQNKAEAARLYKLAADQGNSIAQDNLGAFYELGEGGLLRDRDQAIFWYRKAAAQNEPTAIAALKRLGVTP